MNSKKTTSLTLVSAISIALALAACSTAKIQQRAKETAAKNWAEKAYPGKGYDVQVMSAEKGDGGLYKVKGVVDGEVREGTYDPDRDTFSEGTYGLCKDKDRHVAELEQALQHWKEKAEELDRENYKLKVKLGIDDKKAP